MHWAVLAIYGALINGFNGTDDLIGIGLFVLAGFLSILIHELGHSIVGRWCGAPHTEIELHAFGGFATFPGARFSRGQSIITTFAGPGFQVLAGVAVLSITRFAGTPQSMLVIFLSYFIMVSFFWAILNLIPVIPLDGGQIMAAALGERRRGLALTVSIVVAVVVGAALFIFLKSIIFPLFLGMMAYQNWQEKQMRGF